jgi:hypothetical protein
MANQKLPTPTPEARRMATESYQRALQVFATGNHDYAIWLLTNCCKADPGNLLYHQTLRRVQKSKYNHRRGSRLAFLLTARSRAKLRAAKRDRQPVAGLDPGRADPQPQSVGFGRADGHGQRRRRVGPIRSGGLAARPGARAARGQTPRSTACWPGCLSVEATSTGPAFLWELVRKAVPDDVEASHKAKDLAASETIAKGQYERHLTDPDDDRSTEGRPRRGGVGQPRGSPRPAGGDAARNAWPTPRPIPSSICNWPGSTAATASWPSPARPCKTGWPLAGKTLACGWNCSS